MRCHLQYELDNMSFGELIEVKIRYGRRDVVARTERRPQSVLTTPIKKADVAEHPAVSHHVGLLLNEPPGMAELLFN